MSWTRSQNGGWYTGRGIKRKEVNGPCRSTLQDGETHTMRYPRIKTIFGIEYKTGDKYAKGFFDAIDETFVSVAEIPKEVHGQCFAEMLNPVVERPEIVEEVDTIDETAFFEDQLQQFTQSDETTKMIFAAFAIVAITALTYIVLK